ncbi:AAA family ATPase [Anaerobutyricum soehngenii]|uniref:AAA family ATPase n=1 Tax=Anaerobutyricum soehngenii TaxID=105843 RepID=A0ABS3ZLJ3_9FIRM|nr:AAA family ATPase [Anaerobutyricum soehngenii]MBP0058204.1 AAA family ATPase [Anaerobutyricum soehngenii]
MSNIQITENESGKYSPEWFYNEAQKPEWIAFIRKADTLHENFINHFGIEHLKSLSGKELLTSLFYNDKGNKLNLCYVLEMDKDMREIFGSIAGGAAYKFGLFFHKKTQSWTCGSPAKPVKLTENEAIQKAEEIRNNLVAGAEIISSFGPLNSTADYEQLYKQLEHISGINTVWRMKYYQMLFPILFAPFYGQDIQLDVLHFLNQTPSEIPFIRMGQIALFSKKCNIPGIVFGHIWGKSTNHNNKSNDSETNTLSDKKHKLHYWMYTVFDDTSWMECQQKEIMVLGMDDIGDYSQYDSKESLRQELISTYDNSTSRKNQALMAWNFANKLAINDVIFAKRSNTLVGKGIVTGDYIFDDSRQEYKNIRTVKWLQIGEWEHPGKSVAKRLTDITPYTDYIEKLITIFTPDELDDVDTQPEVDYPEYFSADFLSDVYMSEQDYETLVNVLKMKKNIILQGAPGVGKTFTAKRLAYSIIGAKNPDRVQMIQFHQSYSYEDFIEGYRPTENGFTIKKGSFYKFCKLAEDDDENDYFFIIDEINRGNLSKIFGELFMLIEKDKRGIELQLLYSDENFSVPPNVYIIGMMNTADRSLAMLDYALRRRFSFFTMKPGFNTIGFQTYQDSLKSDAFNKLISCIKQLNSKIAADISLGEGFCIGHSYFCGLTAKTATVQTLTSIIEYELIPLLKEYWFDEPEKIIDWSDRLRSTVK